jgi:D-amino-acid dehydrogenase
LLSRDLYDDIKRDENFSFHYQKNGLFMLCQTNKALEGEIKTVNLAKQEGLQAREISVNELKELEPNVNINVKGATFYECDSHITPTEFMQEMKAYLEQVGVKFYKNEKVEDLNFQGGKIASIKTNKQTLEADEFVLAAGSWSSILSKKLNLKLLLQAGKGYRINTEKDTGITIPAILTEAKVAVTPMHGFTRFSGTMEIAGINQTINKVRVEAIANATTSYYPDIKPTEEEKRQAASGLRPVSPDGLPYIGKSQKCNNLTIATGHAMMGLSMATGTGKLVSEIISNKRASLNLDAFNPDRKF